MVEMTSLHQEAHALHKHDILLRMLCFAILDAMLKGEGPKSKGWQ